jgi:hypothetical protein
MSHTPAHIRAEAIRHMPFLNSMRQPMKFRFGCEPSFTNAELSISFKSWLWDNRGKISQELHDLVDAWVIALAGMSKNEPSWPYHSMDDLNEEVAKATPFLRHHT